MSNPFTYVEKKPVKGLKPYPKNPRRHPKKEIDLLVANIERFGFTNPILIQKNTGYVIAGHGRLKAAQQAGLKTVPVLEWDVADEDALAHLIADNRLQEMSGWDVAMLKDALAELDGRGYTLSTTGFEDLNVDVLLSQGHQVSFLAGLTDEEDDDGEAPEVASGVDPASDDAYKLVFVLRKADREFVLRVLRQVMARHDLKHTADALVKVTKEEEARLYA